MAGVRNAACRRYEAELNYYDRRNQFRRRLAKSDSQSTDYTCGIGSSSAQKLIKGRLEDSQHITHLEDPKKQLQLNATDEGKGCKTPKEFAASEQHMISPPILSHQDSRASFQSPSSFRKLRADCARSPRIQAKSPTSIVSPDRYFEVDLGKLRQTARLVDELSKPAKLPMNNKPLLTAEPPTPRFYHSRKGTAEKEQRPSQTSLLDSKTTTQTSSKNQLRTPSRLKPLTSQCTYKEWLCTRLSPERFDHTALRERYDRKMFTHNFTLQTSTVIQCPQQHSQDFNCEVKKEVEMIRRIFLNHSSEYDSISQRSVEQSTPALLLGVSQCTPKQPGC